MSTSPEGEFDLEKLFLPAWAQESPTVNRYERYTGNEGGGRRSDDSGERRRGGPRRDGPRPSGGPGRGPQRGPGFGSGPRPGPGARGDRPAGQGRPGGRPQGGGDGRGGPRRRDEGGPRRDRDERREAPLPLPEIIITLMPDDKGVESISRQIKMSGRSFPLFDIAHMILQKPERQQVRFEVKKKPDGQPIQPLFLCAIDDTVWLSEQEAVDYVLGKQFAMFYQAEKKPTDPPKGTYTFVAQCGMSGIILGPPNYHDYQNQLRKLHAERFSRMPFEVFKARVKIVREEAVVKKWIEDQSFKTEYTCLNVPEATTLNSREEVEKHFREVHLPNVIKQVEKHLMTGPASRQLRSPGLQRIVRQAWEDQKRFPLQIATILSQQFASHGLQFFKVNRTITHVTVARPHFLDMELTPVSDQVHKIVDFINATPKATRRKLLEVLAPTPVAPATPVAPPAPAAPPATEAGTEAGAPGTGTGTEAGAPATAAAAEAGAAAATAAPAPAASGPTSEQASIIGDLHWLIHQGHVIEFANGFLEMAKKPLPRPPKPVKAPAPPPATEAGTKAGTEAGAPAAAASEVVAEQAVVEAPSHESPANAAPPTAEVRVEHSAAPTAPVPETSHETAAT